MMVAINCVEVDCKDQNKCSCMSSLANAKMAKHFEIPQLMPGLGVDALAFVGSTDRSHAVKIYYNLLKMCWFMINFYISTKVLNILEYRRKRHKSLFSY